MKDLCQKWKVKLYFEAPTGCQEPGLLSVWKSLTQGVIWNSLMACPDWPRHSTFYDRSMSVHSSITYCLFVCVCVSVYVLTVQQTQFHSTASVAPADLRLRVAADNALDQPIGVDAQILRTGRAVECYVLWNTQNHPSNKYYAAKQDCLRCDSKVLFLPPITPRRNVNFKGRARTPITRVGGY